MLTKKRILETTPKVLKVPTPEWEDGEFVFVRKLSGPQVQKVQALLARREQDEKASTNGAANDLRHIAELCCIFMCDEKGAPVFEVEDAEQLFERSYNPIQRCVDQGLAFNHMTEESMKEVEASLKKTTAAAPG